MIDEIQVQNLALIREASLEPSPGMTVLTGETGAGKTALLMALKLLMGARSDKDAVRDGEEALLVSGRFSGMRSLSAGLEEDSEPIDELVISRRVSKDGRTRISIDGRISSVKELSQILSSTIDLCGQHEHQQLMKQTTHVELLDAWAAELIEPKRKAYGKALKEARDAADEMLRIQQASEASETRLEEERFVLHRIDSVSPQEGEYDSLLAELARSENAEALAVALGSAHEALGAEGGVLDKLAGAINSLEGVANFDAQLGAYAESLRECSYVLEDIARETRTSQDSIEFDPSLLTDRQQRMAALQGLLRAYGPRMEDVLDRRAQAADLVSLVDDAKERQRLAQKTLDLAEAKLEKVAKELEQIRREQAPLFSAAVTQQMARLEMTGAALICEIARLPRTQWTQNSPVSVEFQFCPAQGMQSRPFTKIASGGEISRVMLAIKVVLGETDSVDTLVFDEVDAGVGGATAIALAEVLSELAKTHQVIVVSHLAQVAVRAQTHYLVQKSIENGRGSTLRLLDSEERPAEIARMLSGETSKTSLAHAREMLEQARLLEL